MDILTLFLFCLILLASIVFKISLVIALLGGLVLFIVYGLLKGHSFSEMLGMAFKGVKTVKNILITFIIIGMLTALWRTAGTIPSIICYASVLIKPSVFIVLTFLLNAGVSTLTGTSFGTAATMGVICVSIANAMGINVFWTGGALLAGCYFGDRCSPVSTSALLVSTVTDTDLYDNIKNMYRTCIVPAIITCIIFAIVGFTGTTSGETVDVYGIFGKQFVITPIALIPAIAVLVLALFRIKVKKVLLVSCMFAFVIAVLVQKVPVADILRYMVLGFSVSDATLAPLINGGGIKSMIRVGCIVCIASSYSGIFDGTGLLDSIKLYIRRISDKTCPFVAIFLASIAASAVACNQTLSILLTNQLCNGLVEDKSEMALCLEDTAVIFSPMIPWSIAGTVALTTAGAPLSAMAVAVYLYILPLYRCITSMMQKRKAAQAG